MPSLYLYTFVGGHRAKFAQRIIKSSSSYGAERKINGIHTPRKKNERYEREKERKKVREEGGSTWGKHRWTGTGCDFGWIRTAIMLCSTDRTKNRKGSGGFGGSSNGTYYAGRAESYPVALPVSIGSISLSSCQLFLCARQIVAAGIYRSGGESTGDGGGRERERGRGRWGGGVKLTLLL